MIEAALLTIVSLAVIVAGAIAYASHCYDQGVLDATTKPYDRDVKAAMRRAQRRQPEGREPVIR